MGISTHILDTALGLPAVGVPVELLREEAGVWVSLRQAVTDAEGRVKHLLAEDATLVPGTYRVRFEAETYYAARGAKGLYPYVEITLLVRDTDRHLHIPLLLTANGYTTYRGS